MCKQHLSHLWSESKLLRSLLVLWICNQNHRDVKSKANQFLFKHFDDYVSQFKHNVLLSKTFCLNTMNLPFSPILFSLNDLVSIHRKHCTLHLSTQRKNSENTI